MNFKINAPMIIKIMHILNLLGLIIAIFIYISNKSGNGITLTFGANQDSLNLFPNLLVLFSVIGYFFVKLLIEAVAYAHRMFQNKDELHKHITSLMETNNNLMEQLNQISKKIDKNSTK
jgi:hypothetical protein